MFRAKINVAGSSGTTVFSGEMASPPSSSNPWLRLQVVVNKKVVVPYRNPVRIVDPQLLFGYVFRVLAAVFEGCVSRPVGSTPGTVSFFRESRVRFWKSYSRSCDYVFRCLSSRTDLDGETTKN